MSTSNSTRKGSTRYDQVIIEVSASTDSVKGSGTKVSKDVTVGSVEKDSTSTIKGTTTRDGTDTTVGTSNKSSADTSVGTTTRDGTDTSTDNGKSTSAESSASQGERASTETSVGIGKATSLDTSKTTSVNTAKTVTGRELSSNSVVTRMSSEKVNIGFAMSFKVPIIGRFPKSSTSC